MNAVPIRRNPRRPYTRAMSALPADRNTVSTPLASACSTSAPVPAPPRPWRRTAGSVATPTISVTRPTGWCIPAGTGPASPSAAIITDAPSRGRERAVADAGAHAVLPLWDEGVSLAEALRPRGRARRAEGDVLRGDGARQGRVV